MEGSPSPVPQKFEAGSDSTPASGDDSKQGLPSLSQIKRTYDDAVKQSKDETEKKIAKLRAEYLAQLQALLREALADGKIELAKALSREPREVESISPIGSEKSAATDEQILKLRRPYLQRLHEIEQTSANKNEPALTRYVQQLRDLIARLDKSGDVVAAAQARMELLNLHPDGKRWQIERTPRVGGGGGGQWESLPQPTALLVGFRLRQGDFAGHNVLTGLQPVFLSGDERIDGESYGPHKPGQLEEAAPGYAVGALNANSGQRVDGFEIVFMRIAADGQRLEPADSYKSNWFGGHGGGGPTTLGGDGRMVVGIFGASGLEIDSLGLLQASLSWPPIDHFEGLAFGSNLDEAMKVMGGRGRSSDVSSQIVWGGGEFLGEPAESRELAFNQDQFYRATVIERPGGNQHFLRYQHFVGKIESYYGPPVSATVWKKSPRQIWKRLLNGSQKVEAVWQSGHRTITCALAKLRGRVVIKIAFEDQALAPTKLSDSPKNQ
jgi:hypothetical protein